MNTTEPKKKTSSNLRLYLTWGLALVFAAGAIFLIYEVNTNEREQALLEAESKSQLILNRNLAIHAYFSHQLKPKVFELTDPYRSENYFEPSWMSSTFAVREIDKQSKVIETKDYYYKECAINARSPENEADEFEKAFIKELNGDPQLQSRSLIRNLNGEDYYVTLRRGEVMEQDCLRCHSSPGNAPAGLIDTYGPGQSFNRNTGEVISAVSIRVPLSSAYARADHLSTHLATLFIFIFLAIFVIQHLSYRYLIHEPIKRLRDKTIQISENDEFLGDEIPLPVNRELGELASSFNTMSQKLRLHMDSLEERVTERTMQLTIANEKLQNALDDIKKLEGILPVCCYCKNIRDDEGTERGKGTWMRMEEYLHHKTGTDVSHGCCPDCYSKHQNDD